MVVQVLPLSVFVIARDEERCIGQVIDSVRDLAAQVVVVDSGSSDRTCDIARERGAEVVFNAWSGYGQQKRFAEERCSQRWLLNLDADEVLSPALGDEIRALFADGKPPLPLYRIKVTTVYAVHREPRWGAEHNSVIRLYDREVARFPDHPTWDAITPPPGVRVGELRAPCWHYSSPGLGHYVDKFNRYTSLQASEQRLKPYWLLILAMLFGFPFDFLKAYLLKRHITGGSYGFALAVSHAYSRFLKNAKMLEVHLKRRNGLAD
jgi:glycosyltransferase involved in cell wall biosynthesis